MTIGTHPPARAATPRRVAGRVPLPLVVPAGLGLLFLVLPLAGLLIRAVDTLRPGGRYPPGRARRASPDACCQRSHFSCPLAGPT
ncbi:hypothetical protein GCM10022251_81500 [Phytohabitans flavus]|uniref:Uncharacterized protein n=1 Tax=Phytohabitans flavus TaxID=1076124 RepID=A0A6F8XLD1_9ACTN|nr:hypothetical protein [Phytohabitans flavus]BCB74591.1 hypothetical protein Pflav_010010 [Phytohabitans flavus]